jgi:L-serine dehydratase
MTEFISVFDVLKIGVGPSSSHTLGPWKAAGVFIKNAIAKGLVDSKIKILVSLYGSLSLTGKGHATDSAVQMGLSGYDPVTVPTESINDILDQIKGQEQLTLLDGTVISFDPSKDIVFEETFLPFHANGLQFSIFDNNVCTISEVYYSLGGGFIVKEGENNDAQSNHDSSFPFPIDHADDLLTHTSKANISISEVVLSNERTLKSNKEIEDQLMRIWEVMLDSIYVGCHTDGILPGVLHVRRRAKDVTQKLILNKSYTNANEWVDCLKEINPNFQDVMKWVGSFAIAVNEVNASFGRVVTAPTNGSAGVIPAVLLYYLAFVNKNANKNDIVRYLCTAGVIGSIFKKQSTISAAMGGCQAEIGVSSAMAAAGLTELLGGSAEQCTIAAEVAMEHHLGMTCDPVAGLVQVPCIERNSMGAIKAINAASIAVDRNPDDVKVSLDNVISTMWSTAQDMNRKYKETSEGGLAVAVNQIDC